jgi:hypothetical protein
MALSEDQKAMLRLLAQREQGYDDLAALMGLSVDEVRAKVKDALAQLESQGKVPPPAPVEPPAPRAAPVEESPQPEATPEPAKPEPSRDEKPMPDAPKPPSPAPTKSATRQRPKPTFPEGGGARAAIAAGALAVVALIVVLIVGGGDDSGNTTSTTGSGAGSAATEAAVGAETGGNAKEVTRAILGPVAGGGAEGIATFGRVKNSLALQLEAAGLEPTAQGQSYTVWLYQSPRKMLPLASTRVGKSGDIGVQVQVPTEVLGYLANEAFDQIDVSLTDDAALKASLAKATREKKAPIYTGTHVLRGRITGPIIGAARK